MAVDTRYVTHGKWTSLSATELTYPNGRQVTSGYDALYRRNTVNETSGGASIAAWQFFGNRTATVALGNGITCSFMNNAQTNSAVQSGVSLPAWGDKTTDRLGYDGSGRMIAKRFLPSGSTTSLVGFTTAYDPSSNKQFERALQGDESRSGFYPAYDSMDRLLQYQRGILASGGGSVTTPITLPGTDNNRIYDLDGLGNWKNTVYTPEGASPTTEIRQHNKLNEITQFATTPVTYDHGNNAGNSNPLIAQRGNGNIANDGTRIYAYDALNRLTTVKRKSDNAQVAAYTYDALGRRVLKTVTNGGVPTGIANVTYRYLYDGQQIVEELLVGGTTTTLRQFVWGQYIDELIQLKVPTTTTTPPLTAGVYYPLQDLLFRTTATTDSSGAIKEAYDYDAYGNTLMFSAAGTGGNWWADNAVTALQPMCEFLFTGRQYDPETEIYWYRARYYHITLSCFLQRDSQDFLNLSEYAKGNPINGLDPSGEVTIKRLDARGTKGCRRDNQHYSAEVTWDFLITAKGGAPCDGYFVQQVDVWCEVNKCDKCPTGSGFQPSFSYWEAWPVKKGRDIAQIRATKKWAYTDDARRVALEKTCGNLSQVGTVKFFCTDTTKDLGDIAKNGLWATRASYGPGDCAVTPGNLPSTGTKPTWWENASADPPDGFRSMALAWNCCPKCKNFADPFYEP